MPKPSLSSQTIYALLQQRLGAICHFSPLAEGLASQAFGFQQGRRDYVVRVNQSVDGFAKDLFAYQNFAAQNLPIPEVLQIGRLDERHVFCVSRRMPGIRLQDVTNTQSSELVVPALRLIAAIAGTDIAKTRGFGRFDASGVGSQATWRDFLVGINDPQLYDWAQAGRVAHLPTIRTFSRLVTRLAGYCPEDRRLVHGDFSSSNILTDGQSITAIFDWDRALFGDALYDAANVFFWRQEKLQRLIERLEERGAAIPRWNERILCYQLHIGLREIYDSALGSGTIDLTWLMIRCNAILAQQAAKSGRR
jgi:hygromycin-B 4-O-kinase